MAVEFELNGQKFIALNGGPVHAHCRRRTRGHNQTSVTSFTGWPVTAATVRKS